MRNGGRKGDISRTPINISLSVRANNTSTTVRDVRSTTLNHFEKCDCCGSDDWAIAFTASGFDLGRCGECGFYSIAQMPPATTRMTELEDEKFAAETGVAGASIHLRGERLRDAEFRHYVEVVRRHAPDGPWLDIGCGTGQLIHIASRAGIQVDGLELTPDRRDLAAKTTGRTIYADPIEEVDLPAASLAAVTMINVFSHLVQPRHTIARINHLLGPGGILLLRTSEAGPGLQRHHSLNWHFGDHLHFLGRDCVERYAKDTGFDLLEKESQWQPEIDFSVERMYLRGPSRAKNLAKAVVLRTPGAMRMLRTYMLQYRQRGNPMYASTIVLRKA